MLKLHFVSGHIRHARFKPNTELDTPRWSAGHELDGLVTHKYWAGDTDPLRQSPLPRLPKGEAGVSPPLPPQPRPRALHMSHQCVDRRPLRPLWRLELGSGGPEGLPLMDRQSRPSHLHRAIRIRNLAAGAKKRPAAPWGPDRSRAGDRRDGHQLPEATPAQRTSRWMSRFGRSRMPSAWRSGTVVPASRRSLSRPPRRPM